MKSAGLERPSIQQIILHLVHGEDEDAEGFDRILPAGTVRNGPAVRKRMNRITAPTTNATRDGRGSCTAGILEKSESTLHLPFIRDQISAAFRPASSVVAIRDGQVRV